jgi:DNA-binding CsgD family transcriptional regulator
LLPAGLPDEALTWSAHTIGRAEAIDFQWDWLEGLRARGVVALLVGEPVQAVRSLHMAWEHITREGVDEPGVFLVAPDLVEALVELGDVDQAQAVASRLQMLAEQQGHPRGLASAKRCSALIRLASPTSDDSAATDLQVAAGTYESLGLRFEGARTLLALGKAERRVRKWGAAALARAGGRFEEIGSTGWADRTLSELDRIGARRTGRAGELTSTERRVVELAANGRSNKEIAHALFVAISTVEGHLSHAYRKLGVRSRAQLAHQLTRDGYPGPRASPAASTHDASRAQPNN